MTDVKKRIKELRSLIEEYNYHYYILDDPLVSDGEWDHLFKELENIVAKLDVPPPYSLPKILTTIFCNVAG